MNFQESIEYLYSLGHETMTMKFGLDNTKTLLAAFNNPHKSFFKVQIAGTNGKGSVCAFLDQICRTAEIKTGLYTSPHLVSITERIKIDGSSIAENDFARLTTIVRETAANLVDAKKLETLPTFFEHLTIIALLAFREAKITIAILETGLGGRLDATTAAEAEIAGITSISIDHQEYLGETLEQIAAEKAAIIHQSVRAVVVSKQEQVAAETIRRKCAEVQIEPIESAEIVSFRRVEHLKNFEVNFQTKKNLYSRVLLNLLGRHQFENAATAISLAETLQNYDFKIARKSIVQGLETARHAGRLELWENRRPPILFDGAHNIAGASALRSFLLEQFLQTPLTIIFGVMRDKDLAEIAAEIFPLAENLILTRADNPRSAAPKILEEFAASNINLISTWTTADALQAAHETVSKKSLIVVTGSLYLIGEAQANLLSEK